MSYLYVNFTILSFVCKCIEFDFYIPRQIGNNVILIRVYLGKNERSNLYKDLYLGTIFFKRNL